MQKRRSRSILKNQANNIESLDSMRTSDLTDTHGKSLVERDIIDNQLKAPHMMITSDVNRPEATHTRDNILSFAKLSVPIDATDGSNSRAHANKRKRSPIKSNGPNTRLSKKIQMIQDM